MLGRESPQRSLFGAHLSVEHLLSPGSFYEVLYREADQLLRDEDFAACYDPTTGRPSVPPSRMATLLLLQSYEDLSDRAALERMTFDLRWKAVLGMEAGEPAVGQSTLVDFRARLQLHQQMRVLFDRFLSLALEAGLIRPEAVQAIDATAIWGRGAVEDTYDLLGSGMRKLLRATARRRGQNAAALAAELQLVLADPADTKSLKGRAEIDWDDAESRRAFLNRVVEEARHLLQATTQDQEADPAVAEAALLLRRLLLQDLEPLSSPAAAAASAAAEDPSGASSPAATGAAPAEPVLEAGTEVQIRRGVAEDRVVSVHDPEMRVGHKSERTTWEGYKLHASAEVEHEFLTGIALSNANAYDGDFAPQLLRSQQAIGLCPAAMAGDHAYSKAEARQEVAALGSELVARVPRSSGVAGLFSKEAFHIDLEAGSVTCPGGVTTRRFHRQNQGRSFRFPGAACARCPLREQCTSRTPQAMQQSGIGRTVWVHPLEALLQAARAAESSPRVHALLTQRPVAERRLAHLMGRGLRQARYRGREKTEFQALCTALVVNLRRLGTLCPDRAVPGKRGPCGAAGAEHSYGHAPLPRGAEPAMRRPAPPCPARRHRALIHVRCRCPHTSYRVRKPGFRSDS
jgi:transposase